MRKIYLLILLLVTFSAGFAQELSKTAALQLVAKNSAALGITQEDLENSIVSNAYHNKTSGTDLVYLQQSFKGLPVFNRLQTLAFKNGVPVSKAGQRLKAIETKAGGISYSASVTAANAIREAMRRKNITAPAILNSISTENNKITFGKVAGSTLEDITVELMWVPLNDGASVKLAWQVYLVPAKSSDYWMIRVDAHTNQVIDENNLTVYCNFKHSDNHNHDGSCFNKDKGLSRYLAQKAALENDPQIVNGASYRVIPFPAESPQHPGGAHAIVTNPWTAAPNNATTLKWHSDGTNDYTYTRGNNVWAYQDRGVGQNTPTVAKSTASTTTPDPLTFDFSPNYGQSSLLNSPAANKDFNITNLFYWNNIIHDVVYQYGFDEVSGNFQANNQGRGGVGNDYVMAEGQDASGSDNANFGTPADGGRPRMQMYLWSKTGRPAFTIANAPASIAGSFTSVESNFTLASGFGANNALAMVGPVTADVVYYNDNTGATHDACVAPSNSLTGKIVLINRGNCDFLVKTQNAAAAGAVGVIMINNVAGAPIIMGGANAPASLLIPAVMVSDVDGAALIAQVANGLNVTLAPDMIDGDVDNGVIVHEFGHGISNRLTGGPAQANCLSNAEQMGEGWSDYYSLMLTQNWATSNVNTGFTTPRGIGTYDAGQPVTGAGIRTQRYCTDFTVNNLVFGTTISAQQHTRGELWCATLWDMTWNIIQQVNSITPSIYTASGTGGNVIALKLVTEGMKLQPCGPGFIDGRDAILQADQILYNGAYSCAIKEAFRRRGMGPLASQGSSNSTTDQTPDFTTALNVVLTQNASSVLEGQNIVYTNRVTSCGPITNYILRDTLPTNVTYVSGGTYDAATRVVSFPVTIGGAGGSQNYSFTVSVNAGSYYAPTTYLNEPIATAAIPATLTQTSTTANVWAGTTTQSHSAPASLLSPNAATPSDQILRTSNAIALGSNQSSLSFWHWYNTERKYDGGVLEISTDAGTNWNDLDTKITLGYYNDVIATDAGTPIAGRKAYTGNSNTFIKTNVNLSSYAGQSALFRWRFNSDDGTSVVGWFVDDILIKNEAVVNMRSTLFNATNVKMAYADTVTLILQANTCANVAVTTPPANQTACVGANATFTVVAAGTNPTYQWQVSTNGGTNWTDIAGQTTATLTLTAVTAVMNNNQYRVVLTNTCPSTATSAAATLTVTSPSAITTQPAATVAVCAGASASFTVVATGPSVTYQWQVSTNGGANWTDIAGATSATYTINPTTIAMNNNQYRVRISTCAAGGLTSTASTLTVNPSLVINTQPQSVVVCTGGNTSFTVAATGAGVSYQWQISTNGGTSWTDIAGQTTATLSLTAVTAAMNGNQYRVVVNGTSCAPAGGINSAAATLTVNNAITISSQPQNVTLCAGLDATFSVTAAGSGLSYQWQVSTDGTNYTNITGATNATLTLTSVQPSLNNNRYRVVLTGACASITSNAATLTVNSSVTITTQPADQVGCAPAPATFTVAATGTTLTYQWQVSTNGGTSWTNIAGATSATYTITALNNTLNGNRYRVIVTGSPCGSITSAAAVLTVGQLPTVTISSNPGTITPGQTAVLTAAVSPAGTYTYQWFKNNQPLTGETAATLNVGFGDNDVYRVTAFNSNGCSNTSANFSLSFGVSDVLFIYPSPNMGMFHVRYYNPQGTATTRSISVYDSKGALVFTKSYNSAAPYADMEVDIRRNASGVYIVDLLDNNGNRLGGGKVYKY